MLPPNPISDRLFIQLSTHTVHCTHVCACMLLGGTRTCIHTPGAVMTPDEMTDELMSAVLKDAALVYFDGRLTEAALKLARAAR